MSVNKFVNGGGFVGSVLYGLRKTSLYTGATVTPCVFDNVKYQGNSLFTLQPASDLATSSVDGTQYLISNYGTTSVWKGTITGDECNPLVILIE